MTSQSGSEAAIHDFEVRGARFWRSFLDRDAQERIIADIEYVVAAAPFVRPVTPWGKPMSVEMTSAGRLGWITDRRGYRYEPRQADGSPWPPIPESVLSVWRALAEDERLPDCCLINRYSEKSRMGLHQDRDEVDFSHPVLSISLGDDALFRIGNVERGGRTQSLRLRSGDVLVMGGAARLIHHGIDRIYPGTSTLLPDGGRINVTLRVVT